MTIQAAAFVGYLLITGMVSFVLFGVDKWKASTQHRRISEKALLRSVGVGGWIGGIMGMSYFRHKTIKSSFLWKFWTIIAAWLVFTIVALFRSSN